MRKRRSSLVFYVVAIAFVVYAGITLVNLQTFIQTKSNEIGDLQKRIEAQQQKNTELQNNLNKDTDTSYVEKIAREKLGLAYPNERVFYNVDGN